MNRHKSDIKMIAFGLNDQFSILERRRNFRISNT